MVKNFNKFINQDDISTFKLKTNESDDDLLCRIVFANCHNKYPLDKLGSKDLKSFIEFCKKIEKMTWREIKIDEGLNYETPRYFNVNLPDLFPKDATAISVRCSRKFRIIGWREKEKLNLMWFDKNHESYPG